MTKLHRWISTCLVIALLAPAAMAQEKAAAPAAAPAAGTSETAQAVRVAAACLGAALAAIGGGLAIAKVGGRCLESMARQPEVASSMFGPMFVSAAMIEGAMLFAILVCLLVVL